MYCTSINPKVVFRLLHAHFGTAARSTLLRRGCLQVLDRLNVGSRVYERRIRGVGCGSSI